MLLVQGGSCACCGGLCLSLARCLLAHWRKALRRTLPNMSSLGKLPAGPWPGSLPPAPRMAWMMAVVSLLVLWRWR